MYLRWGLGSSAVLFLVLSGVLGLLAPCRVVAVWQHATCLVLTLINFLPFCAGLLSWLPLVAPLAEGAEAAGPESVAAALLGAAGKSLSDLEPHQLQLMLTVTWCMGLVGTLSGLLLSVYPWEGSYTTRLLSLFEGPSEAAESSEGSPDPNKVPSVSIHSIWSALFGIKHALMGARKGSDDDGSGKAGDEGDGDGGDEAGETASPRPRRRRPRPRRGRGRVATSMAHRTRSRQRRAQVRAPGTDEVGLDNPDL